MSNVNVGIQLYSVKDEITKYGIDEVFAALRDAGCDSVEFAGFYGIPPMEMKAKLEKYGLKPHAAHISLPLIPESMEYIDVLGIKEVYLPSYYIDKLRTEEGFAEFVEWVNRLKPELDARGITFGYHNHARELEGDVDLLDKMSRAIDGFKIELDIYWALAGGYDPSELIKKYGDRLTALHIKDMHPDADVKKPTLMPNAIIGEGKCGAEQAYKTALMQGVKTFILEVEFYPCDYKEYIKKSIENIKNFNK